MIDDEDTTDNMTWRGLRDRVATAKLYVSGLQGRVRLGVYDKTRDGDLLAVLEEIERILR